MLNIKTPPADVAVIVGRFQVHELHPGHRNLLDWAFAHYPVVMVVLGCPRITASTRNPLPFPVREKMIRAAYPDAVVTRINDCRSDEAWSNCLDEVISHHILPHQKPVLVGSRSSFVDHYHGVFPTVELEGKTEDSWSGTKVRRDLMNRVLDSPDFRAGIVYGTSADWPRVIPTIDVAVMSSPTTVIMVRKNGEMQYRFAGGFCEPGSTNEMDVRREVSEEIGDIEIGDIQYVGSFEIDDWRYRQENSRIRTTFYVATKLWGILGAKDRQEIAEVREFEMAENINITPEHRPMLDALREKMGVTANA